jgi:glycosyltransferase involved in cell wall biosynthesis
MKIAYFSPMPSAKTGIASYSSCLVEMLADLADLTVFSPGECHGRGLPCEVHDFVSDPYVLKTLQDYDQIVYQLGNHPSFTGEIYKVFLKYPGVVVLHDTVLYALYAGLGLGGLIKAVCENEGIERMIEIWDSAAATREGDIQRYVDTDRFPLLKQVLQKATGIVVHNRSAVEMLKIMDCPCPVEEVPHPYYPASVLSSQQVSSQEVRRGIGVPEKDVLLGIFGFIDSTKRIDRVFAAVRKVLDNHRELSITVLVVGEGQSLSREIKANRLEGRIIRVGYVNDKMFNQYLSAVDIVVNLRYPGRGETSASLIQAMSFGKPVIVTGHAACAELPDEVVVKVAYGQTEVGEIVAALVRMTDKDEREKVGDAARNFVQMHCAPDLAACKYMAALNTFSQGSFRPAAIENGTERE